MNRTFARIGLLLLATLLGGCVATVEQDAPEAREFAPSIPCVDTMDEIAPQPIPPRDRRGDPVPVNIEDVAACLRVANDDVEPVALFDLGERANPQVLRLAIFPFDRQVMAVRVELLDAHLRLQRSYPFDGFKRRSGSHTQTIFLNPEDAHIRYALIRPDRSWIGRQDERIAGDTSTTAVVVPVPGGLLVGSVTSGREIKTQRVYGEIGTLQIWQDPQRDVQRGPR